MTNELTVLDAYTRRVYKIIMLIIPGSCLAASTTVTTLHYLGYFPDVNETLMWLFDLMDVGFLGIGIFFILTGFDESGLVKRDKLVQGKYTAALIAIVQWNAISYIWPFRDFWAYILLFLLGEAFFFDIKLVRFTSIGLMASTFVSWFINGEALLPAHDTYFVANMTFRLVCIFATVGCINVLTYFGGKFLIEELEKYVYRDPLTNLLTRRTMNGHLRQAHDLAKQAGTPYCLLMMDIDDFKHVNDTYGHDCGDMVLKMVAGIVSSSISADDKAFRWGGEEMLVLLKGDKDRAVDRAEAIRTRVQQQNVFYRDQKDVAVTVTIGATALDPALDIEQLTKRVDQNLYAGKRNGKNQVVFR